MSRTHLNQVLKHVRKTDGSYHHLYLSTPRIPIPFFGKIESAQVLTIGLNPSNTEFIQARRWPKELKEESLYTRLSNYFVTRLPIPHAFFRPWTRAFELMESRPSYAAGTAAHMDLSPCATDWPGNKRDDAKWLNNFLEMVALDIRLFFELLISCKRAKLLLVAGTATNAYYLDNFIIKQLPRGLKLHFLKKGEGRHTSFYRLSGEGLDLPFFFSGAGPAFQEGKRLLENIELNKSELSRYLK